MPGTCPKQVKFVCPFGPEVMVDNPGSAFEDHRVKLQAVAGGNVKAVIVERKELREIIAVLCFGPGQDFVELIVSVEIVIKTGSEVLVDPLWGF